MPAAAVGPEADRQVRPPGLRHRGAGLPEAAVRGRAAGPGRGPQRRPPARPPFLDICAAWSATTAASAACSRSPSRPTTARAAASTSITPTRRATSASTNSSGAARPGPTRGSRRQVIEIPHPVNANHNGGQLQFLGDLLYFGTGDGGSGGDPPNNAQNKDVLLGKLLRIDPRPAGGEPYSVPAVQPLRRRARPRRDLQLRPAQPLPLLLRHGQRRGSRGSRSATSARTASRSSTTRPSPPPTAPTSAGTPSRASPPTPKKTAAPPTPAARPSRSSPTPQPRRQLLDHRRLRRRRPPPALSIQALRLRRLLRGPAAQPRPPPEAGQRRPQARPRRRQPQPPSAKTTPRPPLRRSLAGPVYRLVPR